MPAMFCMQEKTKPRAQPTAGAPVAASLPPHVHASACRARLVFFCRLHQAYQAVCVRFIMDINADECLRPEYRRRRPTLNDTK